MKRLTQLLAVFIVLYLIVSAVRPDISQNWRDDWRALFQSDSPSTALVSTPVPPTNAPEPTAPPTPSIEPTPEPTLAPTVPTPTSETLSATATPQPTDPIKAVDDPAATSKPTATALPTATFTPTPTQTPIAVPTTTPIPNTPTVTPIPTATNTPTVTPTPTPTAASGLTQSELTEARDYALKLINDARTAAGLNEVTLDDNTAAQSHAEDMRANCFSAHWGSDGFKPYMRYTLAGGQQYSAENISGLDYCVTKSDGYRANISVTQDIRESMTGLMESPGHRRNILNPYHRKVNIGLAWDDYNFNIVQLFVGDYVEYHATPHIENGILTLSGKVNETVRINDENALEAQIYYDPLPFALTRGQLSRTYCVTGGRKVAALRPPLEPNWHYNSDSFETVQSVCPDPYDVPADAPAPTSADEAHAFWQQAYDASQSNREITVAAAWITATNWSAQDREFAVSADISDLLQQYGDGVYSILLWGEINGEDVPISEYSIFVPPNDSSQTTVLANITAIHTVTPTPTPTPIPTITPTPTVTNTPTVTPTSIPTTPSGRNQSDLSDARQYTLDLINQTRTAAGLNALTLDDNTAAQSHAEDMRTNCTFSHWGTDGLKPYIRYTLAGGHHYSDENIVGYGYCPPDPHRYITKTIRAQIDEAMEGLLNSPGHSRNILNPHHRKVNIGISYQRPNLWLVQHFVGDYLDYTTQPAIDDGVLNFSGQIKNGATLTGNAFGVQIYYDQPPHNLTRGQLHLTYCYALGAIIAGLRSPPGPNAYYPTDVYTISGTGCNDPYDVPIDAPPATSYFDIRPNDAVPYQHHAVWITANDWSVTSDSFAVSADISDLLIQYGDGVYTILLWAKINGEDVPISEYSIFVPPLP